MQIKGIKNSANELLYNRRTIRQYDPSVKISREEMDSILQDAMTAPSSLNLQPWHFIVVDTPEGKELIKPYMMFNQKQLETSSAIIVVLGDKKNVNNTEPILEASVEHGLMSEDEKEQRLSKIQMYAGSYTDERIKEVVLFDCGLVSMQIMLAAKAYGYDTNIIGGFMKDEIGKALSIDKQRFFPVVLISIGEKAEEGSDTIRLSAKKITEFK